MGEKFTIGLAGVIIIIMLPCLLTLFINGRQARVSIEKINSGRDVLILYNGENVLMDVEEYIVGVLPGMVEYGAQDELVEAQAVAVRTKIYYAMGENTVINASDLEFEFFGDEKYINKYGIKNYAAVKSIFEEAVISTAGKVIESK